MDDKEMSVHAKRLFVAQSKAAHERNKKRCICEHSQKVRVATASLGVKTISLAQHGTVHLSSCQHSDLARTCWVDEPRKSSGRKRLAVTIEEENP
jgi:hypothetical protein